MKRLAIFMTAVMLLTLCSCKNKRETDNDSSDTDTQSGYTQFMEELGKDGTKNEGEEFCFKDLDGNGAEELIAMNAGVEITVFDSQLREIGNHNFSTGTLRLLSTDNPEYHGIIYFFADGGKDHYGYITVKDGALVLQELWTDNYSAYELAGGERITEISSDKQLIAESKKAYEQNKDITFYSLASYNTAIKAYNQFLSGVIPATDINGGGETFYIDDTSDINLQSGINKYSLLDITGDGIPELHTKSYEYHIFSISDGRLVQVCSSPTLNCATAYIIENGALFWHKDTIGTTYDYITINADLTTNSLSFFDGTDGGKSPLYYFEDKQVTKTEFDNLTREYLSAAENPADMVWFDYK